MFESNGREERRCSLEVCAFDERFKLGHGHALLVTLLALGHGLLDDGCDLFGGLCQHLIHILCHWVHVAQVLQGRLCCLRVRVQGGLVLFQELLFDSDVMIGDAKHNQAVFRLT